MELYEYCAEYEKSIHEEIQTSKNPAGATWMLIFLHQAGADLKVIYDKHKAYLHSRILKTNTDA